MPAPETVYDLNALVPDPLWFRIRDREIGIAPVFSVADNARCSRIQERLAYETAQQRAWQQRLAAFAAARQQADADGSAPPTPPELPQRDPTMPPYTNEAFERDVLDLLTRIWQASEQSKLPEERESVTPESVRDLFTAAQAWTAVQRLWPRRYDPRTVAPADAPSAPSPTATPTKPTKRPRSRA